MKIKGRPRILSHDKEVFLNLYLNPLMSAEEICRACNIKKSTFYNYEKELNLPQLRVAVGNLNASLPRNKALKTFIHPEETRDLQIVQRLGKELQARIKIIPIIPSDIKSSMRMVESKSVDFLIAQLSATKERSKTCYFSDHYIFDNRPQGVLIQNPKLEHLKSLNLGKPLLGVPASSPDSEHADEFLIGEFRVRHFFDVRRAFMALQKGQIDFVLVNPVWFQYLPVESAGLKICSKPYLYKCHSGMAFHADSEYLRTPVNNVLHLLKAEFEKQKTR